MEPSVIFYWKQKPQPRFAITTKIFYQESEVNQWYKMNRHRVDGLSVVVPLKERDATIARLEGKEVA